MLLDFSLLQGAAFVIEAVCEELEVGGHEDDDGAGFNAGFIVLDQYPGPTYCW